MVSFKGFGSQRSKKDSSMKKEYFSQLKRVCGDDEQAQTEVNRLANESMLPIIENYVRIKGFTLLVFPVREFFKQFGALNPIDFKNGLIEMCEKMMQGRIPEKSDCEAIAFLKSKYGYTDDDFPPLEKLT